MTYNLIWKLFRYLILQIVYFLIILNEEWQTDCLMFSVVGLLKNAIVNSCKLIKIKYRYSIFFFHAYQVTIHLQSTYLTNTLPVNKWNNVYWERFKMIAINCFPLSYLSAILCEIELLDLITQPSHMVLIFTWFPVLF